MSWAGILLSEEHATGSITRIRCLKHMLPVEVSYWSGCTMKFHIKLALNVLIMAHSDHRAGASATRSGGTSSRLASGNFGTAQSKFIVQYQCCL